jgi:hypothetical protein
MDHIHLQLTALYADELRRSAESHRLARSVRSSGSAAPRPRRSWRLAVRRGRAVASAA